MTVRLIDIACGAGLASAGVLDGLTHLKARGQVVAAVDPWAPAAASYRANVPELSGPFFQAPAEEVAARVARLRADLVITGPPCQGDSTLSRCRIAAKDPRYARPDRRQALAAVKHAAVVGGQSAPLVVMEIVGRHWDDWAQAQGAQLVRLADDQLGGATIRRRTFAFFGPWRLPSLADYRAAFPWTFAPTGWDTALLVANGPGARILRAVGRDDCVLANDADREVKRRNQWRAPGTPGFAVAGHGTAHRVYRRSPWEYLHRYTPAESAVAQGFDGVWARNLRLLVPAGTPGGTTRNQQTLVGNGWPASYGRFVALALIRSRR